MSGRVLRVATWLVAGQLIVGGLYWAFLNTPESNTLMLGVSVLLLIAMILSAGFTIGAGLLSAGYRRTGLAIWGAPWVLVAAVPPVLLWWLVGIGDRWLVAHSGEIAAWFIARFGWADMTWLMRALDWLSLWLRGVVAPLLGLALFNALLLQGAAALGRRWWLGRALRFSTLIVSTLAFSLFVLLPLQAAYWPSTGLPPTWVQPALAGLRLLAVGLIMTLGWAIIVWMAAASPPDEIPTAFVQAPASNSSEAGAITLE